MRALRLATLLIAALLPPVIVNAQEERRTRAGLPPDAGHQIVQKMPGTRPRSTAAPVSCTAAKGNLTLGQAVHPFLGDSSSCYQDGVWIDFWTFTAASGTTVRLTFSSESASVATFQDFSTGAILASSSDSCGGLVTACTYDYGILTSGQYVVGFGSYSTQNYNLSLSLVTGGAGVNLLPYKPAGWSDKIVVSTTAGANTDSASFHTTDTIYVDWAVVNSGTAARPAVNRSASLSLDGTVVQSWSSSSSLDPGNYGYYEDFSIGSLPAGNHTLKITADPDNEVAESNESDNEYSKTITVSADTGAGACTPTSVDLCLSDNRFRVSVNWSTTDGRSGQGQTIPLTSDTGHFWFFTDTNVELVVKVLDGRAINNHFWVFYGALSNVQYVITVLDTETQTSRTYTNPQGTLASVADTAAF